MKLLLPILLVVVLSVIAGAFVIGQDNNAQANGRANGRAGANSQANVQTDANNGNAASIAASLNRQIANAQQAADMRNNSGQPNSGQSNQQGQSSNIVVVRQDQQNSSQQSQANAQQVSQQSDQQGTLTDGQVLGVLVASDQAEVNLAQYALPRLTTQGAREFAQQMINDHSRSLDQLTQVQASQGITVQSSPQMQKMQSDLSNIERELSGRTGADVDRFYISHELSDHQDDLNSLHRVLLPSARNQAVKQQVNSDISVVQQHLQHVQQIIQNLQINVQVFNQQSQVTGNQTSGQSTNQTVSQPTQDIAVRNNNGQYTFTCNAGGSTQAQSYDWSIHLMPGEQPVLAQNDISQQSIAFTPQQSGLYQVYCAATRGTGTQSSVIFITANVGQPSQNNQTTQPSDQISVQNNNGQYTFTCNAGGSTQAQAYDWSIHFMPGEIPVLAKTDVSDRSISFAPQQSGLYQVYCAATRGADTQSAVIFVNAGQQGSTQNNGQMCTQAQSAQIFVTQQNPQSGQFTFVCDDIGQSFTPKAFVWDFGDGTSLAGPNQVFHQFTSPGTYTVRCVGTDAKNAAFGQMSVNVPTR